MNPNSLMITIPIKYDTINYKNERINEIPHKKKRMKNEEIALPLQVT
jgi:hypothetical protein